MSHIAKSVWKSYTMVLELALIAFKGRCRYRLLRLLWSWRLLWLAAPSWRLLWLAGIVKEGVKLLWQAGGRWQVALAGSGTTIK